MRVLPVALVLAVPAGFLAAGGACRREERRLQAPPAEGARLGGIRMGELRPGPKLPAPETATPYEANAYAISEGQRLFGWFNCVGCHAHGGGAIGPPLMDDTWIYGSDPANIYATIVEGRPQGMPSYRGKISDVEVWQLVAYVRSLAGLQPVAATPVRDDHLQSRRGAP
jgi:cytochrome c oxidase cbb3-type subunit 3